MWISYITNTTAYKRQGRHSLTIKQDNKLNEARVWSIKHGFDVNCVTHLIDNGLILSEPIDGDIHDNDCPFGW